MAGFAGLTALCHATTYEARGFGSIASLVLAGPILDFAVRRARTGRGIYAGVIVAGLATNLVAFAVRLTAKIVTPDVASPLSAWLLRALPSYAACGIVAGLVSAALWFRYRDTDESSPTT